MKNLFPLLMVCLIILAPDSLMAREVKGVNFPETATIGGATCKLTGVGIRKKLIINVYLGALYLEKPTQNSAEVIASDQTKQVMMHFLYKEVSADQLVEAWTEGFKNNSPDKVSALKAKIDRFNAFFSKPVKSGERITVTYIPGTGTEVSINGTSAGVIEGKDFMEAVFAIWFGPKPPSSGLKEGMLGE
ncbi:chalcone isomerase family protein [bacterium]|nr:chalcone isomerase family protein [bacterium]